MDLPLNQTSFFSSRAVPNIYLITENMKVWNIIHTSKPLLTANRFDRNIQIHPFHRKVSKCTKLLATPAVKYKVLQSYNKNRLKFGMINVNIYDYFTQRGHARQNRLQTYYRWRNLWCLEWRSKNRTGPTRWLFISLHTCCLTHGVLPVLCLLHSISMPTVPINPCCFFHLNQPLGSWDLYSKHQLQNTQYKGCLVIKML